VSHPVVPDESTQALPSGADLSEHVPEYPETQFAAIGVKLGPLSGQCAPNNISAGQRTASQSKSGSSVRTGSPLTESQANREELEEPLYALEHSTTHFEPTKISPPSLHPASIAALENSTPFGSESGSTQEGWHELM
jgi:hypothetical protein